MKNRRKISVSGQVAILGFALLYLLSVVLQFSVENTFNLSYSSETDSSVVIIFPDNQKLILVDAALTSNLGLSFFSEKGSLVLPALFFLSLLLLTLRPLFIHYTSPAFRYCFLHLIRVLPNAP